MDWIKLTKFDAARRQLETGIRMFFREEDPIAIHALAFAAHELLYDIGKKRGVSSLLKTNPFLKPEGRKIFDNMIRTAGNFLKHGQHDSEAALEFNPEVNEYFLVDAAEMYKQLAPTLMPNEPVIPPIFEIMRGWFKLAKRGMFSDIPEYKNTISAFDKFNVKATDKAYFLQMEKSVLEAIKNGEI